MIFQIMLTSVRPIYKNDDRNETKSYRSVSILYCFSKIHEKFLNEQILPFLNRSISDHMPAYRSGYSTNHVLTYWKLGTCIR